MKYIVSSVISLISSFIFLCIGFYKLNAYENGEYTLEKINVYVGGDAYNYIINGTYATAYFVLSVGLLCFAVLCIIARKIDKYVGKIELDEIKIENVKLPEPEKAIESLSEVKA